MKTVIEIRPGDVIARSQAGPASIERLPVRTSLGISGLLLLGGLLEVAKNSAIAYRFGSGKETDAFFAAYIIPATYAMFWVSSCQVGLVPLLAVWVKETEERIDERIGAVLALSGVLTLGLTAVGYFAAPGLMKLLVPGFSQVQKLQAIRLFRELTPIFLLVGTTGVASAVLNCRRRFLLPAAQKLFVNTVVLAGLLFWYLRTGIDWLSELIVLGTLAYASILVAKAWKLGVRFQLSWPLSLWETRALLGAILMPFAALIVRQGSMLAERTIASFLPAGSISALTYAYQVIMGFGAVIVGGVTTALMPSLSQQKSEGQKLDMVRQGLYYLLVVLLPVVFGGYLLAEPLVLILFQHGAFAAADALVTTRVFQAYVFGMIFAGAAMLFQAPFWADRKYRLLVTHNGLMALINVVFDLILVPFLGAAGLALGYTLTGLVSTGRMARLLARNYGTVLPRESLRTVLKPVLVSLIMAGVVLAVRRPIAAMVFSHSASLDHEVFSTTVVAAVGALTYVVGGLAGRMQPFPRLYESFRSVLLRSGQEQGTLTDHRKADFPD